MPRTALLVGASGLVGRYCLDGLLDDRDYGSVTVLGRRALEREHTKLRQHVIDFDRPDSFRQLAGGDDVFCCLGTTIRKAGSRAAFRRVDFAYPLSIAEAALGQGARQFLMVTALGASPGAAAFYSRVKGEVEQAVARLAYRSVHVFRPSLLVGERAEFRLVERLATVALAPLSVVLVGPLRRYRPVRADVVAACMIATAKRDIAGVHTHESDRIAAEGGRET
jgi:uncharacterized protein YbjT (DUF2867 family)